MALLEIRKLTRRFGSLEAVSDVSLVIEAGEFFTLLGPSGCGKTTILRMIAGFDAPDEGEIAARVAETLALVHLEDKAAWSRIAAGCGAKWAVILPPGACLAIPSEPT